MESWIDATRAQYDDDTNLATRQELFNYLTAATPLAAPMDDMAALDGQRVLDVGCGNGTFLQNALTGGATAVGLDFSHGMVSSAHAVTGAPVAQADAQTLPFADDSFDTVLALWMLYHVPDVPMALTEMKRVLAAGGQVVATTNSGLRSSMDELMCGALEAVLGHPVEHWHPPLTFTAENGGAILRGTFDDVVEEPFGTSFEVGEASMLVRYAGSMLEPVAEQHGEVETEAFLLEVGRRSEAEIEAHGTVRIERAGAVFIAR